MNLTDDLLHYYRWLRQYGINDSHSGNASVREGRQVWVTPTNSNADTLTADQFVACHLEGEIGAGASQDAGLHLAVYRANSKLNALLHSHGPYSVAMTLNGMDYLPQDFEGQLYFPRVPVIDIPYERYFADAAARVAAALAEHRVAIVRGHGVYAGGATPDQAYKWTCSLEQSAKTAFIAQVAGRLG